MALGRLINLRARVAGWLRAFGYPAFVFAAAYMLVCIEAAVDSDAHMLKPLAAFFWVATHTVLSCALAASLALAFGRWSKVAHAALFSVIAYAFFVDLCELYVARHFPDETILHGTMWLSVLRNSSTEEVCEFLSCNVAAGEWVALGTFLLVVAAFFWLLWRFPVRRPSTRSSLACLVCCVLFSVATSVFPPHEDLLAQCLFDSGFREFPFEDMTMDEFMDVGREVPPAGMFATECKKGEQPFGLVIIGESATRRHWSLYGYPRNTTPKIDGLSGELVAFSSVRASYWLTLHAMVCMLTGEEVETAPGRFALPSIVKSVGMSSTYVSGQGHWGHVDGADMLFFRHSLRKTYLADSREYGSYWDGDLVDVLRSDFAPTSGVDLCFAHLMGSHFDYEKRYPPGHVRFPEGLDDEIARANPERKGNIAAYDNSVAYTDEVVAEMIESVRAARGCSFVLYVSDHGESPESDNRDIQQECLWEVPMFVWFSPGYRARFHGVVADMVQRKDIPVTNAVVYDIVLELLRINDTAKGK